MTIMSSGLTENKFILSRIFYLFLLLLFIVEEGIKEYPAKVCSPTSIGTTTARCSTKYSQTCRRTVQQSSPTRLKG